MRTLAVNLVAAPHGGTLPTVDVMTGNQLGDRTWALSGMAKSAVTQ